MRKNRIKLHMCSNTAASLRRTRQKFHLKSLRCFLIHDDNERKLSRIRPNRNTHGQQSLSLAIFKPCRLQQHLEPCVRRDCQRGRTHVHSCREILTKKKIHTHTHQHQNPDSRAARPAKFHIFLLLLFSCPFGRAQSVMIGLGPVTGTAKAHTHQSSNNALT